MRRLPGAVLLSAAALAVPATAEAMIQIDQGIAGVRLGNTKAQVKAALGNPASIRTGTNDFGSFTVWRFAGKIKVTFQSGPTVTAVSTSGLGDRTANGVGVRSKESRADALAGVKCETIAGTRSCHTGSFTAGKRVTDFLIGKNHRVKRVTVGFVID